MFKKILIFLMGVYFCIGYVLSQKNQPIGKKDYKLGFSAYLSHTDKYGASFDICTDGEGNIYYSGNTRDKNFPATEGAYQTSLKGEADAFVAKFTPKGKLVFATLIGGTKREHHTGITVDRKGCIYLVGGTHSSDFPVTPGSYDTSFNGEGEWAGDVFLVKLNPKGSDIIFSTFIGGKVEETGESVCIDSKGNIVIAGATCSSDFPTTTKKFDTQIADQDGFLAKFSPDGKKLLFSTSLGNKDIDMITDLAIDSKNNMYITGYAATVDLPVTDSAIRKHKIMATVGGFEDGIDHFVGKINEKGTKILYLSYLGGGGHMGSHISWNGPNKLLVTGSTKEKNFPITEQAVGRKNSGERDCFFSVFNSDDMTLEYSSLLGGSEADHIMTGRFLNKDMIVIGGKTSSPDFPLTDNAIYKKFPIGEKTFNSTFFGRRKAFVSVIDIKNNQLIYSTYLGACIQFEVQPDKHGNIGFIAEAGQREIQGKTDFPVTQNAFQVPPTILMLGRLTIDTKDTKNTQN